MADVSFVVSTVGLTLPFIITDGGAPISNALSASVVWHAEDGRRRTLALLTPVSAVFTYTVSARDWLGPRYETGRCFVSFGTNGFWTGTFSVHVAPHG